jgi:hypothetical protein
MATGATMNLDQLTIAELNALQLQIGCELTRRTEELIKNQNDPMWNRRIGDVVTPVGTGLTTDRTDPGINKDRGDGQHETYIVLSEEERAKGYVRPVRLAYRHKGVTPKHPTRALTDDEHERYNVDRQYDYVLYEEYPDGSDEKRGAVMGRFWTREQLESGCQTITSMGRAIAETYARDPKFYHSTYCVTCRQHFPVEEFVWVGTNERVGS